MENYRDKKTRSKVSVKLAIYHVQISALVIGTSDILVLKSGRKYWKIWNASLHWRLLKLLKWKGSNGTKLAVLYPFPAKHVWVSSHMCSTRKPRLSVDPIQYMSSLHSSSITPSIIFWHHIYHVPASDSPRKLLMWNPIANKYSNQSINTDIVCE